MAISITRALTEIKTLDKRILEAINGTNFVFNTKGRGDRKTVPGTNRTVADIEADVKARFQQVNDFINRRKALKDAVQKSNGATVVTIGGVDMTVQQAIERKQNIQYEQALFNQLRANLHRAVVQAEQQNGKLNDQIEAAVAAAYGNDKVKLTSEQYAGVATPRLDEHEYGVLDPLNAEDYLRKAADKLNTFVTEVDFVLSESNARTSVEV